jgi:hypothetical protein
MGRRVLGRNASGTSITRDEWGRRVIAAALRRLRLRSGFRLQACRLARRGEFWKLELVCRVLEVPGEVLLRGRGKARLPRAWLPGDPRLDRRLQLALAEAVADLAERSGQGLRLCQWRGEAARATALRRA